MKCRNCGAEINEQRIQISGTHRNYTCSACNRLHQWDTPTSVRPGVVREGPPQKCEHKDCRVLGALIPLP